MKITTSKIDSRMQRWMEQADRNNLIYVSVLWTDGKRIHMVNKDVLKKLDENPNVLFIEHKNPLCVKRGEVSELADVKLYKNYKHSLATMKVDVAKLQDEADEAARDLYGRGYPANVPYHANPKLWHDEESARRDEMEWHFKQM